MTIYIPLIFIKILAAVAILVVGFVIGVITGAKLQQIADEEIYGE